MEGMLARYLRWQKASGHSPRTIKTHQQNIQYFIDWCRAQGYGTFVEDLSVDIAREYVNSMLDRGLSTHTAATRTRSLKAFSRWMYLEEWVAKDPLTRLKLPKTIDIPKPVLDPKDVDKILSTCSKDTTNGLRDAAIILMLYSTGIRANELVALHREDIDPQQGLILIRKGKGGKFRVVPLGSRVDKAVTRYLAQRTDPLPNLFLTDEGTAITYWTVKEILRRKEKHVGKHLHAHLFRHTFAIQYLRNGGKLETLKAIMGHTEYEMTLHYARIAGVDVAAGHELADPARSLKNK